MSYTHAKHSHQHLLRDTDSEPCPVNHRCKIPTSVTREWHQRHIATWAVLCAAAQVQI